MAHMEAGQLAARSLLHSQPPMASPHHAPLAQWRIQGTPQAQRRSRALPLTRPDTRLRMAARAHGSGPRQSKDGKEDASAGMPRPIPLSKRSSSPLTKAMAARTAQTAGDVGSSSEGTRPSAEALGANGEDEGGEDGSTLDLEDFTSAGAEWEQEVIQLRVGPPDGDVAQVEAFCRIFRQVEAVQGSADALIRRMGSKPKKGSKELGVALALLKDLCSRLLHTVNEFRGPILLGASGNQEPVNGTSAAHHASDTTMGTSGSSSGSSDTDAVDNEGPPWAAAGDGVEVYSQALLRLLPSSKLMELRQKLMPVCIKLKVGEPILRVPPALCALIMLGSRRQAHRNHTCAAH